MNSWKFLQHCIPILELGYKRIVKEEKQNMIMKDKKLMQVSRHNLQLRCVTSIACCSVLIGLVTKTD